MGLVYRFIWVFFENWVVSNFAVFPEFSIDGGLLGQGSFAVVVNTLTLRAYQKKADLGEEIG